MASEVGERVAEVILEDRAGDGNWTEADRLALYLVGSYIPGTLRHEQTRTVAETVIANLDANGNLVDVTALAEFLDVEMAKIAELA